MNTINIFWHAVALNTASYFRVRESLFFSFFFPVFIFILFGFMWGTTYPQYAENLYLGIIAMTIASDALFSVGPVVRIYIATNTLKSLRVLPFNIAIHFAGLAVSRFVALILAFAILTLGAYLAFGYVPSPFTVFRVLEGLLLGVLLFSFMGLFLAFLFKPESGRSIIGFLYFVMLFISGVFYPLSVMPEILQSVSRLLPLTHLVLFLKGDMTYLIHLLAWTAVFFAAFAYSYKRFSIKR